jgi:hypothetical protein
MVTPAARALRRSSCLIRLIEQALLSQRDCPLIRPMISFRRISSGHRLQTGSCRKALLQTLFLTNCAVAFLVEHIRSASASTE